MDSPIPILDLNTPPVVSFLGINTPPTPVTPILDLNTPTPVTPILEFNAPPTPIDLVLAPDTPTEVEPPSPDYLFPPSAPASTSDDSKVVTFDHTDHREAQHVEWIENERALQELFEIMDEDSDEELFFFGRDDGSDDEEESDGEEDDGQTVSDRIWQTVWESSMGTPDTSPNKRRRTG